MGWPAFDAGWSVGRDVIAPEKVYVYDASSSSQGGDAFYCRGVQSGPKLKYWVAHIASVPREGATFSKGARMTDISADHPNPHVHLAVDARELLGHHLETGENYSYGAPTIGEQLGAGKGDDMAVYPWLDEWIEWDLQGQYHDPPEKRPPSIPKDVPDDAWPMRNTVVDMLKRQGAHKCWQEWMHWKDGGEQGPRPTCVETVFEEWHEARKRAQ